eukprot:TRINITY_DN103158_c0_g1_i1.p1 TRINITY_DN103158_c0_g1~~TRINITY_DN103158_c0_g1_i1.p1  ORF type:complete len:276 (-),score=13.53 TRINITY_DN103158_c0_g1_i1:534-1361(-)
MLRDSHTTHLTKREWPEWAVDWYAVLICIAIINIVAFLICCCVVKACEDHSLRKYQRALRVLSGCYVFENVYRCVLPVQYPQRFVWWDTPFSSILLIRLMSTVGELCFICQVACALSFCEHKIHCITQQRWLHMFTQTVAIAIVVLILVAETCSTYATATQNYLGYVFEESCWGAAATIACPAFVLLTLSSNELSPDRKATSGRCSQWQRSENTNGSCCSTTVFALLFSIASLAYATYMWSVDVPSYVQLYLKQLKNGFRSQSLLHAAGCFNHPR